MSILLILLAALCGLALGVLSGRLAIAYDRALAAGSEPDASTLLRALPAAARRAAATGKTGATPGHGTISARGARAYMLAGALILGAAWSWACLWHGWSAHFLFLALACTLMCALAQIDWRTGLLPDALNYPLLALGLGAAAWQVSGIPLPAAIQGALLGYGFLWLLTWLFKIIRQVEGMGRGDFKLAAAIGACGGSYDLVTVLFLASLGGVLFGMAHQRTWRPTGAYPFGPFLAGAGMLVLLSGG